MPAERKEHPERKERSDARRNRALVLAAARSAFAAEGPDVPLDEIARRAGVGAGTVHRHFPTKNALLASVVVDRLEEISELAIQVADAEDAGAAFFDVVRRLTSEARANLVLTTALDGDVGPEISAAAGRLTAALATLLDRAQRAGVIKPDLTAESLHAVLGGVIAMERHLPAEHTGLGLQIVLDGLRVRPHSPQPH